MNNMVLKAKIRRKIEAEKFAEMLRDERLNLDSLTFINRISKVTLSRKNDKEIVFQLQKDDYGLPIHLVYKKTNKDIEFDYLWVSTKLGRLEFNDVKSGELLREIEKRVFQKIKMKILLL